MGAGHYADCDGIVSRMGVKVRTPVILLLLALAGMLVAVTLAAWGHGVKAPVADPGVWII